MAKIKNRARLRKRMLALAPAVKAEIRPALEDGATRITDLQRSLVVVGATGDLKDSIGWTYGDVPTGHGLGGKPAPDANGVNDLKISIYAADNKSFYGRFIEFGTVKMRAKPFFYPAYRALKASVKSKISSGANKALKKAGEIS